MLEIKEEREEEVAAAAAVALARQKATKGRSGRLTNTTTITTTTAIIATNIPLPHRWICLLLLLLRPLDTQHPPASPDQTSSPRLCLSSPPNNLSTPSKLLPNRYPSPPLNLGILPLHHATSPSPSPVPSSIPSLPASPKPSLDTQCPSPLLPGMSCPSRVPNNPPHHHHHPKPTVTPKPPRKNPNCSLFTP